ncbi:calcium permeable stress-gated cation channel 1 [Chrysoperla carnea]|uniref:calcium permeable stress-gated cation channel 1 n=1 Tax=Chrysoperla carnea TaxID=189513 RepID=UPI001D081960|nr:calcium permeable stress-gated cation channel 1 [Chrysoperla carnea]
MNSSTSFYTYLSDVQAEAGTCLEKNRTLIFISTYEGIPETLLLNFIGWLILVLLFTVLRKKAWDYGRLALVQVQERWTQLFYGTTEEVGARRDSQDNASIDSVLKMDQGCFAWIMAVFNITEDRLRSKCGPDALHYISFQKHLLLLTTIFTVVALSIILPINFMGVLQGDETTFGHTTISNLDTGNPLLWVHIVLAFLYIPITLYVMSRCSGRVPDAEAMGKTIMVTNIAYAHRNQSDIFHYFRLVFKNITFRNVELAYDVDKLTKLVDDLQRVSNARLQAEAHFKRTNERLKVVPSGCFLCPFSKEDAIEYYMREECRLLNEVDQERSRALARPLGIAFVTVGSAEAADYIVRKFQPGTLRNWVVSHAPASSDIFWENLSVKTEFWYLKATIINLLLFILLFFLTTPAIIVNNIDSIYIIHKNIFDKVSPLISEFLPTLLLCTVAALLPVIVTYSDKWLAYWTRSQQNYNIMQKTFFFLLFMVLILPSLGLTSIQTFVEWSLEPRNQSIRWECVFLPDKGAFFVNYVITSGLIGTALELIRFPELFMYGWCMFQAKSSAEIVNIRKAILLEFPFGVHYAWTLLVFTIVTTYSLICPLITPFGLMYFSLKHFVDRYNLYFAYGPSNMMSHGSNHIHTSAIYLIRISLALLLAIMAGFTTLRGGMDTMAYVTIIGLIISVFGLFCFVKPCKSCTRVQTVEFPENEINDDDIETDYVAPVLQPNHFFDDNEAVNLPCTQNYGTSVPQNQEDLNSELITNVTL